MHVLKSRSVLEIISRIPVVFAVGTSPSVGHLEARWVGSGQVLNKLGADLRIGLPVEPPIGHIMSRFLILIHLLVLGHVVVGLQWPFDSWNLLRLGTNSQSSTTGKRAYVRSERRPILTLHGYSADIAEMLPAEIDTVIQNMGQRSTHNHFTRHNRTCHLIFRNT